MALTQANTAPSALERDAEMAAVSTAMDSVDHGRGQAMAITGPAGIGKTVLLELAAGEMAARGWRLLRARGDELERDFQFGAALQLFEPVVTDLPDHDRQRLFGGAAGLARPLFDGSRVLPKPDQFHPLAHGLHWLAANLAVESPIALLVDDLHWVDRVSLRCLHYLVARVADLSILVAVTVRSGQSDTPPEVERLLARPTTVSIRPRPLSPEAVAGIVGRRLGHDNQALSVACHQLSGGNPLLLTEVLASLDEAGATGLPGALSDLVSSNGTETVVQTVRHRLRSATDEARRLVDAISVMADGVDLRVVAELAGCTPSEARSAAADLSVIAVLEPGLPLRFTHPLVRQAVADDLGNDTRDRLHRAAATLLELEGSPVELVAPHLVLTRPADSSSTARILLEAARSARRAGAFPAAVRYAERGLIEPPAAPERPALLLELARADIGLGGAAWSGHLESARQAAGDGSATHRRFELAIARTLIETGRNREAAVLLAEAMDQPDLGEEARMTMLAEYSVATTIDVGSRAAGLVSARELMVDDRSLGHTRAERAVLSIVAYQRCLTDGTAKEAIDLARRSVDPERLEPNEILGRSAHSATLAFLFADALADADELASRVIQAARRRGHLVAFLGASVLRCAVALRRGDVGGAIADGEAALADADEVAWSTRPSLHANLSVAYLEADDLARARAVLPLPPGPRWEDGASYSNWLFIRGLVSAGSGDYAAALDDVLECGRRHAVIGAVNPAVIPWRAAAVELLIRRGDRAEARRINDDDLDLARQFGAVPTISMALRTGAELYPPAAAIERLVEALDLLDGADRDLERSRVLLALGMRHRRSGSLLLARRQLREALDAAETCGAVRVATRARAELRAAGGRVRRVALTGAAALTPAEQRVAEVVVAGATNREAAQALFVSLKAVEFHLSSVYRKLGITRRSELAAALR